MFPRDSELLRVALENYKKSHAKIAASKNKSVDLAAARTLTEARGILYGIKRKNK
jgi:hypothetical protein